MSAERVGWLRPGIGDQYDLIESLKDVVFQINSEGQWEFLNPAWTEKTGWLREDCLGQSCLAYIHEDDLLLAQDLIVKTIACVSEYHLEEIRVRNVRGTYTSFRIYARPLYDEQHKIRGVQGLLHDLSDRKQALEELQFQLDFERLIATISRRFINLRQEDIDREIYYALETIGHFLHLDRCYIHPLGEGAESFDRTHEWCGRGIESYGEKLRDYPLKKCSNLFIMLSNSRNIIINDVEQLPAELNEEMMLLKSLHVLSICVLPLEYNGVLSWLIGFDMIRERRAWDRHLIGLLRTLGEILTNALERKKTAHKYRESERRYSDLFNSVAEGLGSIDGRQLIQMCNPAFARILEVDDPGALTGRNIREFVPPELHDFLQMQIEIRQKNKSSQYELPIITAKNNRRTLLVSASPRFDERGDFRGSFLNVVDVTERRNLEEQLEMLTNAAEAASRTKSTFLANMSHELRTPLNSIIGFAELLRDGSVGELKAQQKDYVGIISQSGKHLLELINDVLDLAKIEAGKLKLNVEEFDLKQLLLQCLDLVKSLAIKNKVSLENRIAAVGNIVADEQKLRQIVCNLLSNAIKFTPESGQIGIEARRNENNVIITVWDTGIGIRPEDLQLIFDEFQQVDSSYAKKYKGTGLGLSLCKKLVEMQGGQIWVESQPGSGSRFSFRLPARVPERKWD